MRLGRLAATLVTLLRICGTAHASPPSSVWTISEATAGVIIHHGQQQHLALRGGVVDAGDVVITGANARAVLVRGEEYAVVAPQSRLRVTGTILTGPFAQFFEEFGNVVFSIKKMGAPHFTVKTPYLAAVVKGTTFGVTVDAHGASVQVIEGLVQVSAAKGWDSALVHPTGVAAVLASAPDKLILSGAAEPTQVGDAARKSGATAGSHAANGGAENASRPSKTGGLSAPHLAGPRLPSWAAILLAAIQVLPGFIGTFLIAGVLGLGVALGVTRCRQRRGHSPALR